MATSSKLNKTLCAFIEQQKLFFVATAGVQGHVNVSPKGMNTLRIIDDKTIRWLNLTGSGNETAAHVMATSRMTLMFCAFEGDPMILRVYGQANVLHPRDHGWTAAIGDFPDLAGSRQIFDMSVDLVQTSCGTGVPVMNFANERGETELVPFYEKMGPDGVEAFWRRKNTKTIDGLPTNIFNND